MVFVGGIHGAANLSRATRLWWTVGRRRNRCGSVACASGPCRPPRTVPVPVQDMLAALQAAKALSFTADSSFGAAVAKDKLKTLGSRASVVFERPDSLFAVFGAGGEPDVQMLISGGEADTFPAVSGLPRPC